MYRLGHQLIYAAVGIAAASLAVILQVQGAERRAQHAVGIAAASLAVILESQGDDAHVEWAWWTTRIASVCLVWSWWSSRNLLRRR